MGGGQRGRLIALLREVLPANPFQLARLERAGVRPAALISRLEAEEPILDVLRDLPFTTKRELQEDQAARPPWGSNLTYPIAEYSRLFRTSGSTGEPLVWLDTPRSWQWFLDCWKVVYRAAEVEPEDRVLLPFSFGPFIGFWGAFEAASQLGCLSIPAGGLSTLARLRLLARHSVTVVGCTPTYAMRMAEVAAAEGIDLAGGSVRALVVAGEPGGNIPATRRRIEEAWGARVFDHCGMTEIGAFGYECGPRPGGLFVNGEEFIAEVVEPGGDAPVEPGRRGELVLTNLGRGGSPLIRYRTGDIVEPRQEECPLGIGSVFLEGGILARADDMVTVRGNNVYPGAVEAVLREFQEVAEYRVRVLESLDSTELEVELEASGGSSPPGDGTSADAAGLVGRVRNAIRDRLAFRAEVKLVEPGSLPRFELKAHRFIRERRPP